MIFKHTHTLKGLEVYTKLDGSNFIRLRVEHYISVDYLAGNEVTGVVILSKEQKEQLPKENLEFFIGKLLHHIFADWDGGKVHSGETLLNHYITDDDGNPL